MNSLLQSIRTPVCIIFKQKFYLVFAIRLRSFKKINSRTVQVSFVSHSFRHIIIQIWNSCKIFVLLGLPFYKNVHYALVSAFYRMYHFQ